MLHRTEKNWKHNINKHKHNITWNSLSRLTCRAISTNCSSFLMPTHMLKGGKRKLAYWILYHIELDLPCMNSLKKIIWIQLIVFWWHPIMTEIWVNTGSGNDLLPDGTKPLPEPMLTYLKQGPATFIWEQFHKRYLSRQSIKLAWAWKWLI